MRARWLLFPALLATTNAASAEEIYCESGPARLYDGGHFEARWTVTHPRARRVQLPGQTNPLTWCSISYQAVGEMYRPIEIIQAPKNGQAKVSSTYRILYLASKLGADELTIRVHWIGRIGDRSSATVRYTIQVIDHPI